MPSLANTLRMCHSTVRVLMNSSAAISALEEGRRGREPGAGLDPVRRLLQSSGDVLGLADSPDQFQQAQRVPPGLSDDPGADPVVQVTGDRRRQQGSTPGITARQ